jgi:UrcA family protein
VTYRDLDLTSPEGLRTLRRRVLVAAQTVCEYPLFGSRSCVAETVRSARPQVDQAVARGRGSVSAH